jgi:hypothetical protein
MNRMYRGFLFAWSLAGLIGTIFLLRGLSGYVNAIGNMNGAASSSGIDPMEAYLMVASLLYFAGSCYVALKARITRKEKHFIRIISALVSPAFIVISFLPLMIIATGLGFTHMLLINDFCYRNESVPPVNESLNNSANG